MKEQKVDSETKELLRGVKAGLKDIENGNGISHEATIFIVKYGVMKNEFSLKDRLILNDRIKKSIKEDFPSYKSRSGK